MRLGSKSWREQQKAIAVIDAQTQARRAPFGRLIDAATGICIRAATREEAETSGRLVVDGREMLVRP